MSTDPVSSEFEQKVLGLVWDYKNDSFCFKPRNIYEVSKSLPVSLQRVHQGSGMFSSIMAASVFLQIVLICLVFKRLFSLPYMEVVNSNFRRTFCST